MTRPYEEIWREWYAADDTYQSALRVAYGKRAGDMRYRTDLEHPETVVAARNVFHAISHEMHEYWQAQGCRKADSVSISASLTAKRHRKEI